MKKMFKNLKEKNDERKYKVMNDDGEKEFGIYVKWKLCMEK